MCLTEAAVSVTELWALLRPPVSLHRMPFASVLAWICLVGASAGLGVCVQLTVNLESVLLTPAAREVGRRVSVPACSLLPLEPDRGCDLERQAPCSLPKPLKRTASLLFCQSHSNQASWLPAGRGEASGCGFLGEMPAWPTGAGRRLLEASQWRCGKMPP